MAGLSSDELKKIDKILSDLQSGNINTPIASGGVGAYHGIINKLEVIRNKLLKYGDEKAEYENANKSALASIIHDLKTPLAIISGYVECLQDGMDDKDYVSLIGEKTKQINDMVLSLLDATKEEINKANERMKIVSSAEFFQGVCERLKGLAEKKQTILEISKIPHASLRISSMQIERVIQNIVSNGIKFSNSDSTVKIKFSRGANWFKIKIKDKGIGISKEDLPHIFEQFYRADKSRSDQSGNGIGLYTAKEIVTAHGGEIKVKSKVGKGTTFTIIIPIVRLDREKTFTEKCDAMPMYAKFLLTFFLGCYTSCIYRAIKFAENRNKNSLIGSILSICLMPFVWIIDMISVIVYGRITFLAD